MFLQLAETMLNVALTDKKYKYSLITEFSNEYRKSFKITKENKPTDNGIQKSIQGSGTADIHAKYPVRLT